MKSLLALALLLLSGCAVTLHQSDIEGAESERIGRGGLSAVSILGRTITAHCVDGTEHTWRTLR